MISKTKSGTQNFMVSPTFICGNTPLVSLVILKAVFPNYFSVFLFPVVLTFSLGTYRWRSTSFAISVDWISSATVSFWTSNTIRSFCFISFEGNIFSRNTLIIFGTMAQWLKHRTINPWVPCSKPLGGSKVITAFHPSEVDKISTRNFWELSGKKLTASSNWLQP